MPKGGKRKGAGRPPNDYSTVVVSCRVPEVQADALLMEAEHKDVKKSVILQKIITAWFNRHFEER